LGWAVGKERGQNIGVHCLLNFAQNPKSIFVAQIYIAGFISKNKSQIVVGLQLI